ncbi:MAG: peptide-N-glycosidase F-related protein [Polyangiales bacterium]
MVSFSAVACSNSSSPPREEQPVDSGGEDATTDTAIDDGADRSDTSDSTAPAAFLPGPYGTTPRSVAGPFVVPTSDGPWSFVDNWTGADHYVFTVFAPGSTLTSDYFRTLFRPVSVPRLLAASPKNVHYFFLWTKDQPGFETFRAAAQTAIDGLADADQWKPRVHFVTDKADTLEGWVGDVIRARTTGKLPYKRYDAQQFAVDRTQHVREVGMLGRLGGSGTAPDLSFLASEAVYYEFEYAREQRLGKTVATVVPVMKDETVVETKYVEVTLPDAATMATFDTLEVDLTMNCENHRDGECGAWDYISDLRLCDETLPPPDPDAGPDAAPPDPKCDLELARWITSYWREGRWVTDVSGMLAFLQKGGKTKLRWYASRQWDPRTASYVASMSLRFSNTGKKMRPVSAIKLWDGGTLNDTYAAGHPERTVVIPAGTKKAEVYALITGHGSETEQCAEFCNHTHHFTMNGGTKHSLTFPGAQSPDGCRKLVDQGVVPNQFGTWYFGRGGWCPGYDVRPFVADVTADLKPGGGDVVRYEALIGTAAPVAGSGYGNIDLSAYLVLWQ